MRYILIAALALATLAGAARAQTKAGTTVGQFLLIEPSARISAMGNAGASLAGGLDASFYNPAALGWIEHFDVQLTHGAWLAGIGYDHVAAAMPLGRWGNAGLSITALNSGEIDVRTVNQPLGTGERYSVSDVAIGVNYARAITDRFSAGIRVTFAQETIWHSSTGTTVMSVGTLYRVSDNGLHIGSSLSNFGTQARYTGRDLRILYDNDPDRFGDNGALPGERFTDSYPLPVLFRVGLAMPIRFDRATALTVAVDAFHPSDNTESVSAGAELAYRDLLALRAGYQNLFLEDSEVGLTAGLGVHSRFTDQQFRFDYGWAAQGRLGSTHRFTLGVMF